MSVQSSEDSTLTALSWGQGRSARPHAAHAWEDFSSIYEECFPAVLWYILSRMNDPSLAEDLTAETFEQAMRSWPTFRHESSELRWLLGIARHIITGHRRRMKTQQVSLEAAGIELQDTGESAQERMERHADEERIRRALSELSTQDRDLILLRYAAGVPYAQIAGFLHASEGSLRVRVHRVLGRLRVLIEREE